MGPPAERSALHAARANRRMQGVGRSRSGRAEADIEQRELFRGVDTADDLDGAALRARCDAQCLEHRAHGELARVPLQVVDVPVHDPGCGRHHR